MNQSRRALTKTEHQPVEERSKSVLMQQHAPMWVDAGGRRAGSIASYLEIPFIHKRLIVACTLLGMLLGWVALLVWPRTYMSEAKMMIRVGRESVALDPTATTSDTLMLQKTEEAEIVSALSVLSSRQVAETVVDELGADAILDGTLPGDTSQKADTGSAGETTRKIKRWGKQAAESVSDMLSTALSYTGVKDDISDRELAVRRIESSVSIHSPKRSTVIVVEGHSKTPEMAQAIVRKMTDSFLTEHLDAAHTQGSYEFFEKQCGEKEQQLSELVARRSEFMQKHDIVSIDANRKMLQEQLSGIDRDLMVASGELEQASSEIEELQSKFSEMSDEIVASKVAASDSTWSGMRQRIYELELAERELAATNTDQHPKLIRVRQQLDGAREILAKLQSERVDESTTPNPVKTRLHEELQRQQVHVFGLRPMIEQKLERRAEIQEQTKELLRRERELTKTDRDIRLMESSLQMLREKLEEARVIDELHEERISNVHVFQPATFVERAVSPKKKPLAAGFMFLGLMTGLGLSLLKQSTSPSLRTEEDVENQLGYHAIGNFPRIRGITSLRSRDRKRQREKCQSLISEVLLSQGLPRNSSGRSLGVIGVDPGVGASTLAVNLAVTSSADCGLRTVLVDADARKRSVSKMFGLNGAPGLVELMSGSASHDDCVQRAKDSSIDLIASAADSCDDLLTSTASEISQALEAYLQDYDLLIVDLPAASQPDQAVALAQHLDCVMVVVESEKTRIASTDRLLSRLSESDTEVVGIVLNKTRNYLPKMLRRFVDPQV